MRSGQGQFYGQHGERADRRGDLSRAEGQRYRSSRLVVQDDGMDLTIRAVQVGDEAVLGGEERVR